MSERIKHNFISEIAIGRRQLLITQVKQIYNIIINTDKMYRRENMYNAQGLERAQAVTCHAR